MPSPIMPGQRGHIMFLEHARVHVRDGVCVFEQAEHGFLKEYNIPDLNCQMVLLGNGTSLSHDAAALLASSSVMVAFCGGGGSPLHAAGDEAFYPLSSGDEYRPGEHMQGWCSFWFDEGRRLQVARRFLLKRAAWCRELWKQLDGLPLSPAALGGAALHLQEGMARAGSVAELLGHEGVYAKAVYKICAGGFGDKKFVRKPGQDAAGSANRFLDYANYLAYGTAALALHTLGISYAFPVLHGKTRRGALVFDVADLFKDGICLPLAFQAARLGLGEQEAREAVIDSLHRHEVLPRLISFLQEVIREQNGGGDA